MKWNAFPGGTCGQFQACQLLAWQSTVALVDLSCPCFCSSKSLKTTPPLFPLPRELTVQKEWPIHRHLTIHHATFVSPKSHLKHSKLIKTSWIFTRSLRIPIFLLFPNWCQFHIGTFESMIFHFPRSNMDPFPGRYPWWFNGGIWSWGNHWGSSPLLSPYVPRDHWDCCLAH